MEKLDKVIAGLEICIDEDTGFSLPCKCPYDDGKDYCMDRLLTDCLDLLKGGDLISRSALIENIKRVYCTDCNSYGGVRCRACGTGDALDMLEDAPTVEVVRCKDCKFGVTPYGDEHDGLIECSNIHGRPLFSCNGFCSYGERRTDG